MDTIKKRTEYEEIIKKSVFIARAAPVKTVEEAMDFLNSVKEPKASHNCWAYRIGDEYRSSDDGEPGGTAGRPILSAIEQNDLDQVMVVVTRYFGGIKLGAGGLVRAYSGIASHCLQTAIRIEIREYEDLTISVPFEYSGLLYRLIDNFECQKKNEDYDERGLIMTLRIDISQKDDFLQQLVQACQGEINIV